MIDVGSRVRDYEIVARLKAGGMATLFLARRVGAAGFARHVAIKLVHPHLAGDPEFVRMFVEEAKLSARIVHPNVVHVEELGEADGTYFLVMEYVHGSALSTLLGALSHLERRLSPELAVWIAMRVADGLHAAHETTDEMGRPLGVVHRDVSPQNVLVSSAGHVKLIDFGIAKAASSGKRTETGALKGKIRYMAPEQAFGAAVDRRTDVYALAIVLWEMLTMQRMFRAGNDFALLDEVRNPDIEPPGDIAPELPPELDRAVMRALSKDPAQRPATAHEFKRMLSDALPRANAVDPTQLAEVVDAVLGERMEQRRRELPDSLSAIPLTNVAKGGGERALHKADVLKSMTVSAPGVKYQPDGEISLGAGSPSQRGELDPRVLASASQPGATPFASQVSMPAQPAGPSRDRIIAIAAGAVALVAVGVAGGLLIGRSAGPEPTVTQLAPPVAAPVAPPVVVAPVVPAPVVADAGVAIAAPPGVADPVPAAGTEPRRRPTKRGRRGESGATEERGASPTIYDSWE